MSYRGKVRNGVVEFDPGVQPPDGAIVQITVVPASEAADDDGSLSAELLKLAGTCQGLPTDMAENLDHYLHGLPKR